MLFISSLASGVGAYYNYRGAKLSDQEDPSQIDFDKVKVSIDVQLTCSGVQFLCMNLALWFFSFRYWKISYVIPAQLAGKPITQAFRITSYVIFFLGVALNTTVPILNSYYGFKINSALKGTQRERREAWYEYHRGLYVTKYLIGVSQAFSTFFMFWAVLKLYIAKEKSLTLTALSD